MWYFFFHLASHLLEQILSSQQMLVNDELAGWSMVVYIQRKNYMFVNVSFLPQRSTLFTDIKYDVMDEMN